MKRNEKKDDGMLSFIVMANYPAGRKFAILKPLKKSLSGSFREFLYGAR